MRTLAHSNINSDSILKSHDVSIEISTLGEEQSRRYMKYRLEKESSRADILS